MDPHHLIDFLWLAFAAVWLVTALQVRPAVRKQSIASSLPHRLALALSALLLFRSTAAFGLMAMRFVPDTPLTGWIGVAVALLGLALAVAARIFLGRNWSGAVTVKEQHEFIRSGPYSVVRHPIYSGVLLGLLGTAIVVGEFRGLIALSFTALGLRLKSLKEEQFMEEEFGAAYRDYKRRVKALIPLVW
ncbi:MAG: isoprenylcysteine carboxylmethyltransferase family protein [Candidatus Sulfotelmatobacter sp.]